MQLIIAEKNSVGEAIASVIGGMEKKKGFYIGSNHIVSWCAGHLVGLAEPKEYGEKITLPILPSNFIFTVADDKLAQFNVLSSLVNDSRVTEVVCATDADREGECIFRYVYEKIGGNKPVKRLWTSSLEESAIKKGLANLVNDSEYDNLYNAGFSRAKADWLVGMNFSRHYTSLFGFPENPKTHKKSLNYGRVMTPILQMIVERDDKSKNFVKEKYFTVEINCGEFTASSEHIDSSERANEIVNICDNNTATVKSVKKEIKNQKPPKLYDLTTLQREANRKFGYTTKQTLECVQSLYEARLCTYPRTDSNYITDDMEETARTVFGIVCECMDFAKRISFTPNIKVTVNNDKVSGHHALLPTDQINGKNFNELPEPERNILYLIAARLICATADKYTYQTISAVLECGNTEFKTNGRADIERGWKGIYDTIQNSIKGDKDEPEADEKKLPDIKENQTFENISAAASEHWTSPPKPYTEDTLLSAMEVAGNSLYELGEDVEKKGLGTPATRAAAIDKLEKVGYMERVKKLLIPTDFGRKVSKAADSRLKSPALTVEWETKLQKMEHGEYSDVTFMTEIQDYIVNLLSTTQTIPDDCKDLFPQAENKVFDTCPVCKGKVYAGKFGFFCEHSSKDDKSCNFSLRYEDNFFKWKNVKLTEKMAHELCSTGKTFVTNMTAKSGSKFDGNIVLDLSGEYTNFKIELDMSQNDTEFCKCPKCGGKVMEDKFSFHCEHSKGTNKSCNIYLKKEDNFFKWKDTTLDGKHAKELLTKGKTHMSGLKSKAGTLYNADILLDYSGQYIQYKMELEKAKK